LRQNKLHVLYDRICHVLKQPLTDLSHRKYLKYDKQDQQGKAAFYGRNPHTIQQQEPVTKSPGGFQTKTGQRHKAEHGQINF
jgi:hypothetical protein